MTGTEVARIRKRLGLDPFAFAAVIGVHVSTIYRWEGSAAPKFDPLQREILTGLHAKKISTKEGIALGDQVRNGLIAGGTLHALHILLRYLVQGDPHG